MRIPVKPPLTPELFAPLFEIEGRAATLGVEYQAALSELRAHITQIQQRMEGEKQAIGARLAALDDEEARIKAAMQIAAKERARASLHGENYQEGAESKAAKLRMLEIPAEREALQELVGEVGITGEEQTRYEALYSAAAEAGQVADLVTRKRKAELDRLFPIVKDQFEAGTWSGSAFPFDKDLSRISETVYNMREVTRYGRKV